MKRLAVGGVWLAVWLVLANAVAAYEPPASDPVPDNPVDLVPALRSVHPRLLFTAADVPGMKTRIQGDSQALYNQLLAYLPVCIPPSNTNFQTDATEAQRQGLWRMPTVALHYVLTGNSTSFNRAKGFLDWLLAIDHWETTVEIDSGMSAANMMVGAALTFDWLYNDLDEPFRTNFRNKLLLQARRMYYGGHMQLNSDSHYWQQDPQNNHRHHRDAGLVLAVLAVASPDTTDDDWILSKTWEEEAFIHEWLPPDGSCHEGPTYMPFGYTHLMLAMDATDRCFGTDHLDHDFFRNAPRFRFLSMTPNLLDTFSYGDTNGGTGDYNNYVLRMTSRHRLADEQAAFFQAMAANSDFAEFAWSSVIWHDPTVQGGALANLPLVSYHSDLGLAYMRDAWQSSDAVSASFKCGPYGGLRLNEYRNENSYHYINIAHDDPDAGEFLIHVGGTPVARSDGYSYYKRTSGHNTILINGVGQRGEGGQWTQPGSGDLSQRAKVLRWSASGDTALVEGEAGAAYTGLSRYRRTMIWVKDRYVLVLDDIRPTVSSQITWLVQSPTVQTLNAATRRYRLVNGAAGCDLQLASDRTLSTTVGTSTAQERSTSLGLQQIQAQATATTMRMAAVFDPWQNGNVTVTLATQGTESAEVTVTGPGFEDQWLWQAAVNNQTASTIVLTSAPLGISGWAVAADHGAAGSVTTNVSDGYIEPRQAGLQTLKITFDKPIDPSTVQTGAVTIVGAVHGDVSGQIGSLSLDSNQTVLTVALSSALPDADVYTVTVTDILRAAGSGESVSGDADVSLRALAGDVDASGAVTAADVLVVRAVAGTTVAATTARYDVNGSGAVTAADQQSVRVRLGQALP
ncbi:MAG: heparinase II/III family protein [Planctomycetes bacterium]|nr:heparinase II/III family protein [Planctomycetota bacterium]